MIVIECGAVCTASNHPRPGQAPIPGLLLAPKTQRALDASWHQSTTRSATPDAPEAAGRERDSPRHLEEISRTFLFCTEQRQGRQREEQHRQEAGCDERGVDGGTEKIELHTDLARDDQDA
jgi:hypothetical protein